MTLGNALEAAGLERKAGRADHLNRGNKYSDDELFRDLYKVELQLDHEPGYSECEAHCQFSVHTYRRRFGKMHDVIAHYRKWKSENGPTPPSFYSQSAGDGDNGDVENDSRDDAVAPGPTLSVGTSKKEVPAQLYGNLIDFRGLSHAPINEQGVVFLFGMVSRELGFQIEAVQQGFPDCEGKYLHDKKKNLWAKARIEFEYKASSFKQHGHDPNQCNFIVCWINDWPDCPVKVIELKSEILKLSRTRG